MWKQRKMNDRRREQVARFAKRTSGGPKEIKVTRVLSRASRSVSAAARRKSSPATSSISDTHERENVAVSNDRLAVKCVSCQTTLTFSQTHFSHSIKKFCFSRANNFFYISRFSFGVNCR